MDVRLPPLSSSSHRARELVSSAVVGLGRADLVDDVATLVSELVANAVMHARTEMVLTVDVVGSGVRLTVADESARMPRLTGTDRDATSGRGLLIVDQLSARWGVEPRPAGGKVIWVEIDEPFVPPDLVDLDALIARWDDDEPSPTAHVVDVDVDVADLVTSRRETDDLVRELELLRLDAESSPGASAKEADLVELARRLDRATIDFDTVRRQLQTQALTASRAGHSRVTLHLRVERGAAAAASRFLAVLEEADVRTAEGTLLVPSSTQPTRDVRRQYVEAITQDLHVDEALTDDR